MQYSLQNFFNERPLECADRAPALRAIPVTRAYDRFLRIRHGQLSGLAARLVSACAALIMVPLLLDYLGKPAYGLWMVIASVVAWMQLLDLGMSNGVGNALAEANGRGDDGAASRYVTTTLLCLAAIAIAGITTSLLLAHILPWETIVGRSDMLVRAQAPLCFAALAVLLFLNLPLSLAQTVMSAHQRSYVANWMQIVATLVSLAAVYVAIRARLALPAIILAAGTGQVLALALLWLLLRKFVPGVCVRTEAIRLDAVRRISRSSVPLFLFQIGALATNQFASILLAHVSTLAVVADYNILLQAYGSVFALGAVLSFPYYPAIREAFERRDGAWIRIATRRALLTRLAVVAAFGLPLLGIGDWLLETWLRQPLERPMGVAGWSVFLACMILASASSLLSEVLSGLDDIWFQVILVFVTALVVLAAMAVLLPLFGAVGVFAAMALSTALPIVVCWRRLRAAVAFA
jgi:O-antigen/teichoic acid export membrane protein